MRPLWSWGFISDDKAVPPLKPGESRTRTSCRATGISYRVASRVLHRHSRVRVAPVGRKKADDVVWVTLKEEDVAYIEVLIVEVGTTSIVEVENTIDLAALSLPSRGEARIIARRMTWTEQDRDWAEAYRAMATAQAQFAKIKDAVVPRLGLFAVLQDGARSVVELAAK